MKRTRILAMAVATLLASTSAISATTLTSASATSCTATVESIRIAQDLPETGGAFPMVIRFVGDPAEYRTNGAKLAHAMLLRPGDQVQFEASANTAGSLQLSEVERLDVR